MATAAPVNVSNPPDPQVSSSTSTVINVNTAEFARRDPASAQAYNQYRAQSERALTAKYISEGATPADAQEDARLEATIAANQQFASQITAAGAGTASTATTPLLAQQPQPPGGPPAPVAPAANPQVPVVDTLGASIRAGLGLPVSPAANPQVPVVSTLGAAIVAGLGLPVSPAANPQVPTLPGFTATTVTNVNEGKFRAENPQAYEQFKALKHNNKKKMLPD
jgi:hypothetical protein